ncbi:MAG: hypothetical protein ABH841_02745, partial [Candidatus Nealsonbacteria bacterium]
VTIAGKVSKKDFLGVELGKTVGYKVLCRPKTDSNWLATVSIGDEVILRGVAREPLTSVIKDCELVE